MEDLGLQSGQQSKGLCIALESPNIRGQRRQGAFAVVAEGRMAQVMSKLEFLHF